MSAHMLRCPEGSTNTTWKALWKSARDGCGEKRKQGTTVINNLGGKQSKNDLHAHMLTVINVN